MLIRNGHRVNDVAREPFGPYDFQFGVNEAEIKLYVVADHDRPAKQGGDLISDLAEQRGTGPRLIRIGVHLEGERRRVLDSHGLDLRREGSARAVRLDADNANAQDFLLASVQARGLNVKEASRLLVQRLAHAHAPFQIVGCLIHHPNGSGPSEKTEKVNVDFRFSRPNVTVWMVSHSRRHEETERRCRFFSFSGAEQPFGWCNPDTEK